MKRMFGIVALVGSFALPAHAACEREKARFDAARAAALTNQAWKAEEAQEQDAWHACMIADAQKNGVQLGMTKIEALNSTWGKPDYVNRSSHGNHADEQWFYHGFNYLYFHDGVLTSIHITRDGLLN
jgi:hypothetical protein